MVCSHAASGYLLSNYILVDVNRFDCRDCDVNSEEHERLTNDVIDGLAEESRDEVLQQIFALEKK